jgi:AraC family transcriptional regulator
MTERVVIRQMGQLTNLITPQGTMKTVGTSSEGLILEEHVSPTAELPDFQFLTHTIGVGHTTTPFSMFWKENGLEKAAPVGNGTLFLSTAKLQAGVRWTGLMRMDVLSIGIPTMEQALPEPFTRQPVELVTIKAADPDLVLQHLLTALRIEFQREEPSGKLLLESLGNAVSVYLAQRYGSSPLRLPVYRQGLSRERMLRLVDFIEAHLETNLSVLELSEVACLSPYHCGRMFKRSMGCNLHQYVTTRRIERAKSLLRFTTDSLSQIALSIGFQDQSQFTTAFKRHLHITPGRYRYDLGLEPATEESH